MNKSPDAFRTISEVAEFLETPAHVLRFWESRFPQIKPVKRAGGRRYYRPADLALLSGIRRLLHDEGLTIRGVQKILREQGVRHVSGLTEEEDADLASYEMAEEEEGVTSSEPIALFPKAPPTIRPDMAEAEVDDAPFVEDLKDDAPDLPQAGYAGDVSAVTAQATAPADPAAVQDVVEDDVELEADRAVAQGHPAPIERETEIEPETENAFDAPTDQSLDAAPDTEPSPSDLTDPWATPSESPQPALFATLNAPPPVEDAELPEAEDIEPPESDDEALAEQDIPEWQEETPAGLDMEDTPQPAAATPPIEIAAQATEPPQPTRSAPLPSPLPPMMEITGHWLPADLRALRQSALVGKRDQTAALIARLEALRNRVGDLGRVPRR